MAADALFALMMISVVLAVVLNAAVIGLRMARGALERRLAAVEAEYRLLAEWPLLAAPGERKGSASSKRQWSLRAAPVGATSLGEPNLCAVSSRVTTHGTARTFALETVRLCGSAAAPS